MSLMIFSKPPALSLSTSPPNAYEITLKSMITSWRVLLASWTAAGAMVWLLGHPGVAAAFVGAGLGADAIIQGLLRKRLLAAPPQAEDRGLRDLGWMVLVRFSLGVMGPLWAVWLSPTTEAISVLILMQAWSVCVAVVQFVCAPSLFRRAITPLILGLMAGLWPLMSGPHGLAIAGSIALLAGILLLIGHETHHLWRDWANVTAQSTSLLQDLAMARDQAEQARMTADAGNQAKTDFLAAMSHEIRTPLNGVLGMAKAMANGPLSSQQRSQLDIIQEAGAGLLTVLNDILDVSKIEAGKVELESLTFEIHPLLTSVAQAFATLATKKGIALEVAVDPSALGGYQGDPVRLRQILSNLVANALKFTDTGGVLISAAWDGLSLQIAVTDTGIGMTSEQSKRLFQKFSQADTSTTRKYGGTGLGLMISWDLAALMGGSIAVQTRPGEGSTFTVALPLPRAELQLIPPKQERLDRFEGDHLRVLVAEDHPVNQLVLAALLGQFEIKPTIVADGYEAVQTWQEQPWDIILMDVNMPRMDGPTAVKDIRRQEATLGRQRTPIIALTANAMDYQATEYLAAGMDAIVSKPIQIEDLMDVLKRLLSESSNASMRPAA